MKEKQHGSFYGLGIQIQKRMGKITVIAPMEGTPAYKMGIRAGDIITHIGDEELKDDVTTEDVVRKLRGPKGTHVTITIRRVGFDEPIRMTITRAEIPTKSVRYAFMLEPGRRLHHAVRLHAHLQPGALRGDREAREAGHEEAALRPARQPGRRPRAGRRRHRRLRAQGLHGRLHARAARRPRPRSTSLPATGAHFDQPLVVLVNRGSASASEIVAGAIQDHDRGVIVGQRTWGKGLVQSVYTLSYGAGLALTTARYYTPSGRWIQRDYSDLLAYVNPGDPDRSPGHETGDEAPHRAPRAPSSTRTPAASCTRRAASRRTSSSRTTGTRSCCSSCWRATPSSTSPSTGSRATPRSTEDFTVTPEIREEFFQFVEKPRSTRRPRSSRRPTPRTRTAASWTSRSRPRSSTPSSGPEAGRRVFAGGRPADPEGPDALRRGRPHRGAAEEEARDGGQGGRLGVDAERRRYADPDSRRGEGSVLAGRLSHRLERSPRAGYRRRSPQLDERLAASRSPR